MNPSVMVLVKNESYWLPYTLRQLEGVVDSVVIYDVGSTDNTRDIIAWFAERNKEEMDLLVRYLPHVSPEVQGTFRNSMIVEGRRDIYWILDGDELYKPEDLAKITHAASELLLQHGANERKRYGVFKRVEVNYELTMQYSWRRSHHRLYTRDAFWYGTHPGEVAGHKQKAESEVLFDDIVCWHMHNTSRSPKDAEALKRVTRKKKKTYHPGELVEVNLLDELPVLKENVEDFPVSPELQALREWDDYRNGD
jgi:glycosyltransferase involved in cell wall biosynthesis